jgi:uncharacterized Zn finger protein
MDTSTEFEFLVDETYENEKGTFTVKSIKKGDMVIRWENGEEAQTSVLFQSRIQKRRQWESDRREKLAAAAKEAAGKAKSARSRKQAPPAA